MNPYGKLFGKERFHLIADGQAISVEKLESAFSRFPDFKTKVSENKLKAYRTHNGDWSRAVLIIDTKSKLSTNAYFRFLRSTQFFFGFGLTFLTFWTLATLAMVTLAEVDPFYWLFPIAGFAMFLIHRLFLKIGYSYFQKDIDRFLKLLEQEIEITKQVNQAPQATSASARRLS